VEVPSASPVFTEESITLKVGYKSTNVKLKDILYIESMDNYVRIYLPERQCIMSQTSMKNIQELLPEGKFTRVHKSFLVPVHRIASHTSKEITLYGGIRIPVGRSYSKELKLILPEV
jgi:DNA-binding LytR/AlgR family response regulator